MAQAVTDANFSQEVENFDGVVLVDFWAEWCGPCKAIAPSIENLSTKYADNDKVKIVKLDVDENPETQSKFQVLSIPTLIVFKNGEAITNIVGLKPEEEIDRILMENM